MKVRATEDIVACGSANSKDISEGTIGDVRGQNGGKSFMVNFNGRIIEVSAQEVEVIKDEASFIYSTFKRELEKGHGSFLSYFMEAVIRADGENFELLKELSFILINKYGLSK
jgi:hypothetical protein